MELESLVIFLIMVLIIIIPVVIINRKKKLKEKKLVQVLFDMAENKNSTINEYDNWNETAIGIDKALQRIFFVRKTIENQITREIDLKEMEKCRFINTNRVINNKETSQKIIEKLELGFTFRDVKKAELILEFYNLNYDSLSLRDEINLAGKWSEIANSEIFRSTSQN
jgi:hypothetical protein